VEFRYRPPHPPTMEIQESKCEFIRPVQYQRDCISCCFYSSMIYATNVATGFYVGDFWYSAVFFYLLNTSLLFHYTRNEIMRTIDKTGIMAVVIYGSYKFFDNLPKYQDDLLYPVTIVSSFLYVVYLYYYGYYYKQYCYCEDMDTADRWHSLLHLVSCIGNHLILFM